MSPARGAPARSPLGFGLPPEVFSAIWRPRGDHRASRNLKTCEMQHPAADALLADVLADLRPADVRDYPYLGELATTLAELDGVDEDRLTLTAGSVAAIGLVVDALARPAGRLVHQEPVFEGWIHHGNLRGVPATRCRGFTGRPPEVTTEPLDRTLRSSEPAVVTLTNPGNPSGVALPIGQVAELADRAADHGHLLVVDECYGAFSETNHVPLTRTRGNVLVLRSLSKSWALAGARLAVVFGAPELIDYLRRFRADSTVSATAAALALGIAGRLPELRSIWTDVAAIRERFAVRLSADHPEWTLLPSVANFVTAIAGPPGTGDVVARALAAKGIRICGLDDVAGLAGGFRVSVAEPETMDKVADLLDELV